MATTHIAPAAEVELTVRQRRPAVAAALRIAREPIGAVFGLIIIIIVISGAAAPWVAPYDPLATSVDSLQGPSLSHPFGTDELGRDQLSRVIWGARTSLYVGGFSVLAGTIAGSLIGLVSGYLGGLVDFITQRIMDGMMAIPALVLIMALVAVLGTSLVNAMVAISVVLVPSISRVVRSSVLSVKQNAYIEAARAMGARDDAIMWRHILPNVTAPILVLGSALLGAAILIEAGLSFLGLATQPPEASWGLMLARSGRQYMEIAPWLSIFPGLAISITVLAFNMFGDVVRDVLDPRLRGRR